MEAGRMRKHERLHSFAWPGLDLEALISTRSFAESHTLVPLHGHNFGIGWLGRLGGDTAGV
jgi:hypothetical protein